MSKQPLAAVSVAFEAPLASDLNPLRPHHSNMSAVSRLLFNGPREFWRSVDFAFRFIAVLVAQRGG